MRRYVPGVDLDEAIRDLKETYNDSDWYGEVLWNAAVFTIRKALQVGLLCMLQVFIATAAAAKHTTKGQCVKVDC